MRRNFSAILGAAVLAACVDAPTAAAACAVEARRTGSVDLAGIERVVIRAGAGELEVSGKTGASAIEANGRACASSERLLKAVQLSVRREGDTAYVETEMPQDELRDELEDGYAYLDLAVTLPDNLPVDAMDSSGDAVLSNLRSLRMLDTSGDLEVTGIAELADVRDSSGELRITRAGRVSLEDSSGDIRVRGVEGEVEVRSDSSGDIEIEDVGSHVRIRQDSSGDILVARVRGNVEVDTDSSGSITVTDVEGDFTVGTDGTGGIDYNNVRGRVTLP